MRAVADNPELAAASGIRGRRVMITLWTIAGAYCRLGGVLLGIKAVVIPELGWELLMPMFAAVILGASAIRWGDRGHHGLQHRAGGRQPGRWASLQDRVRVRVLLCVLLCARKASLAVRWR